MLSKRDFLTIGLMMLALLFIFQFSQVAKSQGNNYDVNEFAGDTAEEQDGTSEIGSVKKVLSTITSENVSEPTKEDPVVWFVGDKKSGTAKAVEEWCHYRKYNFKTFKNIPEPNPKKNVKMIVFDTPSIDYTKQVSKLQLLAEKQMANMVFNGLPDQSSFLFNSRLKEFFGITEIVKPEIEVDGIQIFSGFLLGGETIYKAYKTEEKRFEDLDLKFTWYDTGLGTKTYMVGLLPEEEVSPYNFPKIMWRNYFRGTFVYAINGNYIDGELGLGFLDSCLYDTEAYSLYPIVNANVISMTDFPYLSNENNDMMVKTYSRDVRTMLRDVAWPSFVSMVSRSDLRLTSFITTKYDYSDPAEPSAKDIPFFLQQLKENHSEAGKSIAYKGGISLASKVKSDSEFYKNSGSNYNYRALFIEKWESDLIDILKADGFENGTIITEDKDDYIVKFADDKITRQTITADANNFSYKMKLTHQSLLTSIGYSNVLIDMNNVVWRRNEADEWQNYFDVIYSNMTSYWSKNFGLAQATASESDARIRTMLAADYSVESDPQNPLKITVKLEGVDDAWFLLRTHTAAVDSVSNGSFEKIDEYVYLLHINKGETEIILDDTDDVFRYRIPF